MTLTPHIVRDRYVPSFIKIRHVNFDAVCLSLILKVQKYTN
jgi:hypothetical protein